MSTDNNENINNDKDNNIIIVPDISKELKNDFNKLVENIKIKQKKKNISLGIIKFIYNEKEYIHCPIKKFKNKGEKIKIGICSHFKSLENNKINRRILSAHKYQYHCNSCGNNKNDKGIQLRFKNRKSVEEVIEEYKNRDKKRKKKKLVLED